MRMWTRIGSSLSSKWRRMWMITLIARSTKRISGTLWQVKQAPRSTRCCWGWSTICISSSSSHWWSFQTTRNCWLMATPLWKLLTRKRTSNRSCISRWWMWSTGCTSKIRIWSTTALMLSTHLLWTPTWLARTCVAPTDPISGQKLTN